jgi:site-specific DNA-methyltransferase (adenine-specific)
MNAPYWQSRDGRIVLHLGDSLDVLAGFSSDSIDLVCTDPPYGEETHKNAESATYERGVVKNRKKVVDFTSLTIEDIRSRFDAAARVAKHWFVATMEFRHAAALEVAPPAGCLFVRMGVWTKPNGMPQISGDRPAQGWEAIAIMHKTGNGRLTWNGGGRSSVFHCLTERGGQYPTQKPLALIREFVTLFSNTDDLVLDPFCGSGTTLIAAAERGRRAIGIDISERALEIAAKRLEALTNQGALFGGAS